MEPLLENENDLLDWKREVLRNAWGGMGRRDFIKTALAGAAALGGMGALPKLPTVAADDEGGRPEAVKTGTFFFPRLLFHVKDETGDQWNFYPVGDVILRKRLRQLTNVNASQDPVVARLADLDTTCRYPFIFATSEGYFDLPKLEEKNLKEFLMRGTAVPL
jgi:hypothetical protein